MLSLAAGRLSGHSSLGSSFHLSWSTSSTGSCLSSSWPPSYATPISMLPLWETRAASFGPSDIRSSLSLTGVWLGVGAGATGDEYTSDRNHDWVPSHHNWVQVITIGFQVIFTLFVGAQGLLMLIFHGFRSEEAREVWKQWLNFVTCRHKKVYGSGASTSDTMKRSTFPSTRKSTPSTSTTSYSLGTITRTNPSVASDTLARPFHWEKSDITETSLMGKESM